MNVEKLKRLQAQVRIGGKGTPRRKKKVVHQTAATDDKKLQSSLKKLSVSTIPGIEEVNIIKDDLSVIHFNNPKAQASLSANTFAITGHGENKKVVEMLPEILPQLGQDTVNQLRRFANNMTLNKNLTSVVEEDDVPTLVQDFDEVSKNEVLLTKTAALADTGNETAVIEGKAEEPKLEEKNKKQQEGKKAQKNQKSDKNKIKAPSAENQISEGKENSKKGSKQTGNTNQKCIPLPPVPQKPGQVEASNQEHKLKTEKSKEQVQKSVEGGKHQTEKLDVPTKSEEAKITSVISVDKLASKPTEKNVEAHRPVTNENLAQNTSKLAPNSQDDKSKIVDTTVKKEERKTPDVQPIAITPDAPIKLSDIVKQSEATPKAAEATKPTIPIVSPNSVEDPKVNIPLAETNKQAASKGVKSTDSVKATPKIAITAKEPLADAPKKCPKIEATTKEADKHNNEASKVAVKIDSPLKEASRADISAKEAPKVTDTPNVAFKVETSQKDDQKSNDEVKIAQKVDGALKLEDAPNVAQKIEDNHTSATKVIITEVKKPTETKKVTTEAIVIASSNVPQKPNEAIKEAKPIKQSTKPGDALKETAKSNATPKQSPKSIEPATQPKDLKIVEIAKQIDTTNEVSNPIEILKDIQKAVETKKTEASGHAKTEQQKTTLTPGASPVQKPEEAQKTIEEKSVDIVAQLPKAKEMPKKEAQKSTPKQAVTQKPAAEVPKTVNVQKPLPDGAMSNQESSKKTVPPKKASSPPKTGTASKQASPPKQTKPTSQPQPKSTTTKQVSPKPQSPKITPAQKQPSPKPAGQKMAPTAAAAPVQANKPTQVPNTVTPTQPKQEKMPTPSGPPSQQKQPSPKPQPPKLQSATAAAQKAQPQTKKQAAPQSQPKKA